MNSGRIIALAVTAAVALAVTLLLLLCRLSFDPSTLRIPPRTLTELVEIDQEFVDFLPPEPVRGNPAQAYNENPVSAASQAAQASGENIVDAGKVAPPKPDVTSERPAPLKRPKKDNPPVAGPSKQEIEQEEARRKARQGIADAFKAAPDAADNTQSKGSEKGNSGTLDGYVSAVNGNSNGSVGGGWIMPKYAKVASAQTGRIELRATVGPDGKVISVEQTGGQPPAGSDAALVARCMAEVKSRRFSRNNADDAPPTATARITYTFK